MTNKLSKAPSIPEGFSVDLMSDIHADKWKSHPLDYAAQKKNDIAIVAGDLADGSAVSLEELKKIAAVYKTVLYVDGNHEFRNSDRSYNFDFEAVEKTLREGIAAIPNVIYLRDKPFVKDGVAIIGRNGHWDYQMATCITRKDAINDAAATFKTTFNKAASFSRVARRDYYALQEQVTAFNRDPSIHTIVVVTHTVPRKELLLNEPEELRPVWQSRAGAGVMRNLLKYDTYKKVKFWLFGHQHTPTQQKIDGVLYCENPRGGIKDANKNYKPVVLTFSRP